MNQNYTRTVFTIAENERVLVFGGTGHVFISEANAKIALNDVDAYLASKPPGLDGVTEFKAPVRFYAENPYPTSQTVVVYHWY